MAMIRTPINNLYVEKSVYKPEVSVLCFKGFTEPSHRIKDFQSYSLKDIQ